MVSEIPPRKGSAVLEPQLHVLSSGAAAVPAGNFPAIIEIHASGHEPGYVQSECSAAEGGSHRHV